MPPIATFEAVDPHAPQKPAVPVAELTPLEPGEAESETLAWHPACSGCGHFWSPGLWPAACLVLLPKRRQLPLCPGCADPERARQAVQRRFLSGIAVRVAGTA